jgi:hypothetical protein
LIAASKLISLPNVFDGPIALIDVLEKIEMNKVFTKEMEKSKNDMNLDSFPEDMYFTHCLINYNLGKVCDYDISRYFSVESINEPDSLGGHNWWLCDPNWIARFNKHCVIKFKRSVIPTYEHRGGWTSILKYLESNGFYTDDSEYTFVDLIEKNFRKNPHKDPLIVNGSELKNMTTSARVNHFSITPPVGPTIEWLFELIHQGLHEKVLFTRIINSFHEIFCCSLDISISSKGLS